MNPDLKIFLILSFIRSSILHCSSFFIHPSGLHPGIHLCSSVRPVILRPEDPAGDPVGGLQTPGALENLPGISRKLSSLAVMGEPGPWSGPRTSEVSNIWYGCSSGAWSMSIS